MSKTTTTVNGSSLNESEMDFLIGLQSLAISEHSLVTGSPRNIREWLTSSAPDSPASHSAPPGSEPGLTTPAICGPRLPTPFAWYDHASRSWRMSQGSLLALMGTSEPFSVSWPRSGTMRAGACYRRAPLVPHTHESDCSYWPTPVAAMGKRGFGHGTGKLRTSGHSRYRKETVARCALIGWTPSAEMQEAVLGIPIGWTDLKPLETDRYRSWLQLHGTS